MADFFGPFFSPQNILYVCVYTYTYICIYYISGHLALEHGFPGDDGPWAGRSDTSSDPPAVEFIYYDDLGIGDDDFG